MDSEQILCLTRMSRTPLLQSLVDRVKDASRRLAPPYPLKSGHGRGTPSERLNSRWRANAPRHWPVSETQLLQRLVDYCFGLPRQTPPPEPRLHCKSRPAARFPIVDRS